MHGTLSAFNNDARRSMKFRFEGGADFLCAGMYDFQMVENAHRTPDLPNGNLNRPWSV